MNKRMNEINYNNPHVCRVRERSDGNNHIEVYEYSQTATKEAQPDSHERNKTIANNETLDE